MEGSSKEIKDAVSKPQAIDSRKCIKQASLGFGG